MATKLKDLKLDDAHATAVLEKAIEYESYTEDMPASKRERAKAAVEQVALMIDAWIDDEVTPDNEDEDVAAMGVAIQEIFEIAGVEIDDEGEVSYVEPADLDDEGEEEGEEQDEDGEAAVDINDIVDGYEELSAAGKVKALKALELDMEDDDDYNSAVAVYEFEEAQEKPSSRVLAWLDDLIPKDGEEGEEEAEEEDEDEDEDEDAEEAGGEGEWEQPWDRYDKQTAVEVKKALDKLLAKDELTADMIEYVIGYENAREKPPARKRIIDHANKLLSELEEGGEAEAEEEEETVTRPRAGRPSASTRTRRGAPKPKEQEPEPSSNGAVFVISGGDEDITAYGIYGAMGAVADLLAAGYEEVSVASG